MQAPSTNQCEESGALRKQTIAHLVSFFFLDDGILPLDGTIFDSSSYSEHRLYLFSFAEARWGSSQCGENRSSNISAYSLADAADVKP